MIRRPDLSRQRLLRVDEAAARRGPWVSLDLSSLGRSLCREVSPAVPKACLGHGLTPQAAPARPSAEATGPNPPETVANDNAAGALRLPTGCVELTSQLKAIPAADWIAVDPDAVPAARPAALQARRVPQGDVVDLVALRRASYRRSVLLALILAVLLVHLWRGQDPRETRAIVVPEPESPAARIG